MCLNSRLCTRSWDQKIKLFLIYNIEIQLSSSMSDPIFNWPMKTIKYIFGEQKIVQLENYKFLYKYSNPTPQIEEKKQKMTEQFIWNMGIGFVLALTSNALLQKIIPSSRKIGITSVILDIGVFTFWGSLMGIHSLNQIQPQMQPFRRKWIRQLHPQYVKVMRYLNKYYQIKLQDQIRPYIGSNDQLSWKLKFDSIM